MGIQANRFLRATEATTGFVVLTLAVYWAHARWFRVDVVLYSALLDSAIAAAVVALLLWRWRRYEVLDALHKALLVAAWLLLGWSFSISFPALIDRSLSFYLLEKIDQRGGGIRLDAMQSVIDDEFMREYRVLDARLTEQTESGTLRIVDGCVLLTDRGRRTVAFSQFFRRHLLPRHRQLRGRYSDQLTEPLRSGPALAPYSCGPGRAGRSR